MEKRSVTMIISSVLFGALALVAVLNFFRTSDSVTGNVIADDVQKLSQIFNKINQTCRIISFDYQKNPINFLNVESFTSSEVGPMNLAYPDKWEGPYLDDNPTVQGKEYMIVHTSKGYFITPGEGVELPNDKVIGTDIMLDEKADIPALLGNDLVYQGRPLAARMINTGESIDPAVAHMSE